MVRLFFSGLTWVAVLGALCGRAQGAGFEILDPGIVSMGRAGAYVARADDLSAMEANPAGLSKQTGPIFQVGLGLARLDLTFTRRGSGDFVNLEGRQVRDPALDPETGGPFAAVSPSGAGSLTPAPFLVGAWGNAFRVPGLTLALGLLPSSFVVGRGYPETGPQRYLTRKTDGVMLFYGVAVAFRFHRLFSVGATLLNGFVKTEREVAVRPFAQPYNDVTENEDRFEDHVFKLSVGDALIPVLRLGLLSAPLPWLELGLSARWPVSLSASGSLGYRPPENPAFQESFVACDRYPQPCAGAAQLGVEQRLPWILRLGARWVQPRFDVEFDAALELWSRASVTDIRPQAVFVQVRDGIPDPPVKIENTRLDRKLQDVLSLRLGGDVRVLEPLSLRAGVFRASSALPSSHESFSLDFPFSSHWGVACGASYAIVSGWGVSVAYQHIFQPQVRVTRGTVQQMTATRPNLGNVINNGQYEVGVDVLGVSLEGRI